MKHLISLMFSLLCVAAAPAPLVITKGGNYTGSYSTISINATDGKPVVIDRCTLSGPGDCITANVACPLTITNCTGTTKPPGHFLIVWRIGTLDVEHNTTNGGGMQVSDLSNTGKSLVIDYNRLNNISGATGPNSRDKVSAIQLYRAHVPDTEIGWNHVANAKGKSAVEDNISLLLAGGTAGHPALVHDNLVDGGYAWGTTHYSGSGIMCFDPGADFGVTMGGYAKIYSNQVVAVENQAYACAGGHDIEICNNRAVNDGSETTNVNWGLEIWNWDSKTTTAMYGLRISAHDNNSYWLTSAKKVRRDYSIIQPAANTDNAMFTSTDQAERDLWAAKCAQAHVCIGPLPATPATPAPSTQPTTQPTPKPAQ